MAQTIQVNNTFTLAGGTLKDATIVTGTGGQSLAIAANASNRLNGVAITGDLLLSQTNAVVRILNGLNINGAVRVSGDGALLAFEGTQTWSAGTVVFEGTRAADACFEAVNASTTLTLGSGFTVHGGYGDIGGSRYFGNAFALVNSGQIAADVSGQSLNIHSRVTLTNNGTIAALAGSTLNITAQPRPCRDIKATSATLTWRRGSTPGAIAATSATVNLGGTFITADLGSSPDGRDGEPDGDPDQYR